MSTQTETHTPYNNNSWSPGSSKPSVNARSINDLNGTVKNKNTEIVMEKSSNYNGTGSDWLRTEFYHWLRTDFQRTATNIFKVFKQTTQNQD